MEARDNMHSLPQGNEEMVSPTQLKVPGNSAGGFLIGTRILRLVDTGENTRLSGINFDKPESEYLPDRWAQLIDPTFEKIPTPLNAHGVVDVIATVDAVMETIHSDYIWSPRSINPHHFQWRADAYSPHALSLMGGLMIQPAQFRNIPPLKGHLPRELENWLHLSTEEPPVPSVEIMYFYTEAWQVAKGLYKCVSSATLAERQAKRRAVQLAAEDSAVSLSGTTDVHGEEYFQVMSSKFSRAHEMYLKRLESIPDEFRIVTPEMSPKEISKAVGRVAIRGSRQMTRVANRAA